MTALAIVGVIVAVIVAAAIGALIALLTIFNPFRNGH